VIYLTDANVLSEPTKPAPNSQVVDWLTHNERNLVVDPIILGEVWAGILALPRGHKRTNLAEWFKNVVEIIECLPWDSATARRWAELVTALKQKGLRLPLLDSMIAATALNHGLTVATRNTRDFERVGVPVFDPFV
jgi:predicted nucleic acid-binding protein